jgi:ABC-2 type transport system permease protein
VAEITHTLAVYRLLVGARIRSEWQHRTSFGLYLLSQALVAGLDIAAIAVLFTNVDALAGWTITEVALLYGINGTAFGLGDVFVSPVELAAYHIRRGTFDVFLLRPAGTLLQLVGSEFALRRLGRLLQPVATLVIVLPLIDVTWRPAQILLLATAVPAGAVIYGAIWVLTSAIAFWTVETQEIASSFTYGGKTLANYPIDVFGAWLRRIVVFMVPIAFVGYLPAAALLGKPMPFDLPPLLGWSSALVAAGLALVARGVWTFAVRHYRSTGS